MSASVFSQDQRHALDCEKAQAYQRIADSIRADADSYDAISAAVVERDSLLTFSRAYANGLRDRYADLAVFCRTAADQAQAVADDFAAHADGSYVPLSAS